MGGGGGGGSGSRHTSDSEKLVLQWQPCQAPGGIRSAPGLVGPASVYCDWVRWERLICNFYLSVAARATVRTDPSLRYSSMLLGREAINNQTNNLRRSTSVSLAWW